MGHSKTFVGIKARAWAKIDQRRKHEALWVSKIQSTTLPAPSSFGGMNRLLSLAYKLAELEAVLVKVCDAFIR
ncbi:MAG: hypothetical protein DMG39_24070 [Acidobacteria bacterium]|nr:MAG: hypothetical protein DMG39_24070 [Acidobacteriota bacterium]